MARDKTLIKRVKTSHKICLSLYLGLIAALLAKTWLLKPADSYQLKLAISTAQIVPLLLPLAGLLFMKPKSSAWLCFILCFYFTNGVLDTWLHPTAIYGWLITSISSSLFIIAMLFTRWQGTLLRQQGSQVEFNPADIKLRAQ